ncbi:hypothetical protein ABS858_13305 [Vibrio neptunius]
MNTAANRQPQSTILDTNPPQTLGGEPLYHRSIPTISLCLKSGGGWWQ